MFLQLEKIGKAFDGKPVLREVELSVDEGEIVVLLGPSGCGKTTLLRIAAGLEVPDHGRVLLRNEEITSLPPHQRNFGFVFQDYALFPHKNVFDNVAFGLRMQQWSKEKTADRVHQILELVGLADYGRRDIHDLSGGEQQRVALARSLAPAPRLLLMDEPLGALDRALRERLMLDLRRILKEAGGLLGRAEGMTAVYVTHDQAEAFAIADRVAVMNAGRFEQVATPTELYRRPVNAFVARFLGMENVIAGKVVANEPLQVATAVGVFQLSGDWRLEIGDLVTLLIRPEAAKILSKTDQADNMLHGRLQNISFRGRYQIITLSISQSLNPPISQSPNLPISQLPNYPITTPTTLKFELDTAVTLPPVGSEIRLALDSRSIVPLERG